MSSPARRTGVALTVLLGVALAMVGCSPGETTQTTRTTGGTSRLTTGLPVAAPSDDSRPAQSEGPFGAEGPDASDAPDPALSGQPLPTVPPGDPGDDTSDPEPDPAKTESHGPRGVPADAMLDAPTVGAVAGGSWTATAAPQGWCATPRTPGSTASRAQLLTSPDGRLVQSVAAYADSDTAARAVATATDRLVGCGFTADRDPRLGEASQLLTGTAADGSEQMVVVLASEGVGVVLLASGSAAATGTWDALADIALGNSCGAAEHGCH